MVFVLEECDQSYVWSRIVVFVNFPTLLGESVWVLYLECFVFIEDQ